MSDVAVIGAGPYGLSIAAHLAASGIDFRIFGTPMQTWRTQMPRGMRLKSEGFASGLYDPDGEYRLSTYCAEHDIPYADLGLPVELETFSAYGQKFQQKYVPMLEPQQVTSLVQDGDGFVITLDNGEESRFRRVVCAIGITHYAFTPPEFASLPKALLSHSSQHADLSAFAGKSVVVVGGGASAADCAALLAEAGAATQIVARQPLRFHAPPKPRTLMDSVRAPITTIGPGWKSWLCTHAPLVFHTMPEDFRLLATRKHLGPAPCWFVRDKIEQHVKVHVGAEVAEVSERNGQVALELRSETGPISLMADHVIAATGYRVNLDKLAFLESGLRQRIKTVENSPILSWQFETSVPNLFFVGASSANSFGPLVRFACGAEFSARHVSRSLKGRSSPVRHSKAQTIPAYAAEGVSR